MKKISVIIYAFGLGVINAQTDSTTQAPTIEVHRTAQNNAQASGELLNCNIIFESRKDEIKDQIRELNEKNQTLQILKDATQNLLQNREIKLKEREEALRIKLKEIEDKEAQATINAKEKEEKIKSLITKNEEILKQIDDSKNNKLAQTYAKMKDSKAALILENLPQEQAASILFALSAQDMGKILSKMNPKKAANLTEILKKGPPFKEALKEKNKTPEQSIEKDLRTPLDEENQNFIPSKQPNMDTKNSPI